MKRKDYQKPTTKIVKLRHTGMLMVSDPQQQGVNSERRSYGAAEEETWN